MKNKLFITALMAGIAISSSAEVVCNEYYGTKANDSTANPCKGSTTRVCAKIWKDIKSLQNVQNCVSVKEVICDANGKRITSSTYQVMNATPQSMISTISNNLPSNAVMYVLSDDEMPNFDE